jgi:hypothetical protein
LFSVHITDRYGKERVPFPERGRSQEEVLQRLLDPPSWTNSVLVFVERNGRQAAVAFADKPPSDQQAEVVLVFLVLPDDWRASFVDSRHRLSDGGTA